MMMLLIPIVLFQVAAQVSGLGALIYASMDSKGLSAPALIALIQATANAGALLVARYLSSKRQGFSPQFIFFGTVFFSILNTGVTVFTSDISGVALFARLLLGALTTSLLLSHGPSLISSDVKKGNQILQVWFSVAALIGFGLAPLLASSITNVFLVDLFLNLLGLGTLVVASKGTDFANFKASQSIMTPNSLSREVGFIEKSTLYVALATFFLWCFGGFFHVVEVPLLIGRFGFSKFQVSAIFIFTLLLNIGAVTLMRKSWLTHRPWKILVVSTLIVALACIVYLQTHFISVVILTIALIGAANGAFNLSQSSILQEISSAQARLRSFIFVRLIAQVGLMVGALVAGSGLILSAGSDSKISSPVAPENFKVKTVRILLPNIPTHIEPFKNINTSSMLVIHQIFDTLFEYDSRNNLNPKLVETLVWKNKNHNLILTLKKNLVFSNGDPLVANDVVNSLKEAKSNFGESGKWAFGYVQSIMALNEHQLEIRFRRPFTLMPAILASPYFRIFKRVKNGNIFGTGDYLISSRTSHQLTLLRNPLNKTIKYEAPDLIEISDKFEHGVQYTMSYEDLAVLGSLQKMTPVEFKTLQTVVFLPNFLDPIFKSKEARCSLLAGLSQSIPLVYKTWKPADLGLPFSSDLFPPQAGAIATQKKVFRNPIQIHFSNSIAKFEQEANIKISERLRDLGFPITFEQIPIAELARIGKLGRFSGLMFGFGPDFVHPHALISPLLETGQTYNFGQYKNKDVDHLLGMALTEIDRTKQNKIYSAILQKIKGDCAIGFLGSQNRLLFFAPEVHPPDIGQLGLHNLRIANFRHKGVIK